MIFFLSAEQVIAIHDIQIEYYGGLPGLRDIGTVEGMLGRVVMRTSVTCMSW